MRLRFRFQPPVEAQGRSSVNTAPLAHAALAWRSNRTGSVRRIDPDYRKSHKWQSGQLVGATLGVGHPKRITYSPLLISILTFGGLFKRAVVGMRT